MGAECYDALVIGGGFYGCSIALFLAERGKKVLLAEREDGLLRRASYTNQARVHNGYHYPRSLQTAYRSRINFQRFVEDYPNCIVSDFTSLYCVARSMSKVSASQFERFCSTIGAPLRRARDRYTRLFNARLIEAVYEATEYTFDSVVLCRMMESRLNRSPVEVRTGTAVEGVETRADAWYATLSGGGAVRVETIFNCAYAGLKHVPGLGPNAQLKYEMAEMALIDPPEELKALGVTVMCGPFFSTLPFPSRGLHTLSHVRYTPHASWEWNGGENADPYQVMASCKKQSRGIHMIKDAQRYMPLLGEARIVDSLFEIKTLLGRNEIDDGRPILMEGNGSGPKAYSIMGGKIDNIFDVFHLLEQEAI